jgi:hypothetical protein
MVKTEDLVVGKSYICRAIGVDKQVTGILVHKYENTVMLLVEDCADCDKMTVMEKGHRVIVRYPDISCEVSHVSAQAS